MLTRIITNILIIGSLLPTGYFICYFDNLVKDLEVQRIKITDEKKKEKLIKKQACAVLGATFFELLFAGTFFFWYVP